MPIQAFALEIKKLTEKGTFEGLASTYGNVDQTGDVVMQGAFTTTLQQGGIERPLLWQHRDPIGVVKLTDSSAGLVAEGQLSLGIQLGKDAYTLLRDGVVKGLSIGFQTVKEQFVGEVRQLLSLKLFEVSLVTFPANLEATVATVKSAQHHQIQLALKSFRTDILRALNQ
jgi:HK97 family phage prohead protease